MKRIINKIKTTIEAEKYVFSLMWKTSPWQTLISIFVQAIDKVLPLINAYLWMLLLDQIVKIESGYISPSVWVLVISFFGTAFINNIIMEISSIASDDLAQKSRYMLNKKLMYKLSDLEYSFYDNPSNRDALARTVQFQESVGSAFSDILNIIMRILSLVGVFIMFLPYNPLLGVLYVVTIVPGSIATYKHRKNMNAFSINSIPETRKKNYFRSILTEASFAKELRLYNLFNYMKEKFNDLWNKIRKQRTQLFKKGTFKMFFWTLFSAFGYIVLIIWSVRDVTLGAISIGVLGMYLSLAINVNQTLNGLFVTVTYHFNIVIKQVTGYQDFMSVESQESNDGNEIVPDFPTIEFRNVYFKYPGSDNFALAGASFFIGSKKKVALIGENGSGKTTIINLLLRLYDPQEGDILIDGKSIKLYNRTELRSLFAVCFQNFSGYALSVRENVFLSDVSKSEDTALIKNALNNADALTFIEGFDDGIESNLTRMFYEDGKELSGGQWQKLSLARTFFKNANFIILDEPSSSLDPEAEHEIFQSFEKLYKNKGGIIVSHRLSVISIVDEVILLEKGKVIASGTHELLYKDCEAYRVMYKMQADKYLERKGIV